MGNRLWSCYIWLYWYVRLYIPASYYYHFRNVLAVCHCKIFLTETAVGHGTGYVSAFSGTHSITSHVAILHLSNFHHKGNSPSYYTLTSWETCYIIFILLIFCWSGEGRTFVSTSPWKLLRTTTPKSATRRVRYCFIRASQRIILRRYCIRSSTVSFVCLRH